MAVGRISGPLLKDNLLRNGVNLAFETSLLYLDVVDSRIGINTATPAYDLDVNGTTRSTNLYATTQANLATFTITGTTISSTSSTINLTPSGSNPTVFSSIVDIGNLQLTGNTLSSNNTNGNITISANGTGSINLNSNVLVTGNLHATGTITADGNITLGSVSTDTIAFTGEVDSNILPNLTNTYTLGSSSLTWSNLYSNTLTATTGNIGTVNATTANTSELSISGNTISAINTNTDIDFVTSGTGGIVLGNLRFLGGTITNTVANSVTQFATFAFVGSIAPGSATTLTGGLITGTALVYTGISGSLSIGEVVSGGTCQLNTYIIGITTGNFTGFINGTTLSVTSGSAEQYMIISGGTVPTGTYITIVNTTTMTANYTGTTLTWLSGTLPSVGMILTGTGIPTNTYITGTLPNDQFTLSNSVTTESGQTVVGVSYTINNSHTESSASLTGTLYTVNYSQTSTCTTVTPIILTISSVSLNTVALGTVITQGAAYETTITATSAENSLVTGTTSTGTYLVNIPQTVSSTAMTGSGTGYVQIGGTYGVVVPVGSTLQRPTSQYSQTGMVRFNTDSEYVEVFNGTVWTSVAGTSSGVTSSTAQDIGVETALALG